MTGKSGHIRKGKNTFAAYQRAKVDAFEAKLGVILTGFAKLKIKHPSYSALVKDVADRLGCHRTTLTRNKKYSTRLLTHFIQVPGGIAVLNLEDIPDDAPPDVLKAMLLAARIELGEEKNQRERLERRIKELETGKVAPVGDAGGGAPCLPMSTDLAVSEASAGGADRAAFEDTAMVVYLIWGHFKRFLLFQDGTGQIIERGGAPGEEMIAGPERTKALFTWLRQHKDILGFSFSDTGGDGRK